MDINKFRSSFTNGEPASPTLYEVSVIRQPIIGLSTGRGKDRFESDVKFRCISCSLPGRILNTTDRMTYGPTRKIVTSTLFQDVTFSFIVSDDKNELNYFDKWHNYIVDNSLFDFVQTHDVGYYDEYVGDIKITHFDKQNNLKYTISLIEAYPISVEEIPLSWDNNNEFIRVNVTVAYRNWIRNI